MAKMVELLQHPQATKSSRESKQFAGISLKFNNHNIIWSNLMETFITGKQKLGFIHRHTRAPEKTDPTYENWIANDAAVRTWIQNSMETKLVSNFARYGTTRDLWAALATTFTVLLKHSDSYPQLLSGTRRASHNLISKKKEQSVDWVNDLVQMEKLTDYTCNPKYMVSYNKLMSHYSEFVKAIESYEGSISIEGFGTIDVRDLYSKPMGVVREAFDLKVRITAYWKIVMQRMVDNMALHLQYNIQKLVNKEMQTEMINELIGSHGNGLERMLEEPPSISEKRNKLKKSIKLLKESKDVVANIMDRVVEFAF